MSIMLACYCRVSAVERIVVGGGLRGIVQNVPLTILFNQGVFT